MKKLIMVILSVLLLLLSVSARADPVKKWIDEEHACFLGQTYLKAFSGMSETDYNAYCFLEARKTTLEDGTPVWCIGFMNKVDDPCYVVNIYNVFVHAYSGAYKGLGYPTMRNPVTAEFNRLRNEVYKKDFVLWTIQQKYDFSQTFPQLLQDFEALSAQDDTNYVSISSYLLQLLQYDYRLPDEKCINQEEAVALAKEALKMVKNFTDDYILTHYNLNAASFLFSHQFSSEGKLVWKIIFIPTYLRDINPSPQNEQGYDCGYYVEIDAYNGQIVGIMHQRQNERNPWACLYE